MKCLVNILDRSQINFERWGHGEAYGGHDGSIAKEWSTQRLGFHVELLDAGKFACPYHTHTDEEELMIVLEGEATVRQDNEYYVVKKGDLVFWKLGVHHQMYNHTDKPFYFFMLSNKSTTDLCSYPDSRKTMDCQRTIKQDGQVVTDYWKDEETPANFWPASILKKT